MAKELCKIGKMVLITPMLFLIFSTHCYADLPPKSYMDIICKQLEAKYLPAEEYKKEPVSVDFRISKDGQVSNIKIRAPLIKTPQSKIAGEAVMKLLETCAPFDKLPPLEDHVDLNMMFRNGKISNYSEQLTRFDVTD